MQYIDIILQFQIYKKIKLFEKCTKADIKKPSLKRLNEDNTDKHG